MEVIRTQQEPKEIVYWSWKPFSLLCSKTQNRQGKGNMTLQKESWIWNLKTRFATSSYVPLSPQIATLSFWTSISYSPPKENTSIFLISFNVGGLYVMTCENAWDRQYIEHSKHSIKVNRWIETNEKKKKTTILPICLLIRSYAGSTCIMPLRNRRVSFFSEIDRSSLSPE